MAITRIEANACTLLDADQHVKEERTQQARKDALLGMETA